MLVVQHCILQSNMQQTSGIASVCHLRLKHYNLTDQLNYMLLKHFIRQEVGHILLLALHRSCPKQFDVDHFCQKTKKFQFVCLTRGI